MTLRDHRSVNGPTSRAFLCETLIICFRGRLKVLRRQRRDPAQCCDVSANYLRADTKRIAHVTTHLPIIRYQ
jgi:hypothetical protein